MSRVFDIVKKWYLTLRGCATPAQTPQSALTWTTQGHTDKVSALTFFKDGRRVLTSSWDHTLRILDVQNGARIGGPFKGHRDWVWSVAISPDDRRIASSGDDHTIIIWDVESKRMMFEPLVKHTRTVFSVCFSPDGKSLASGSRDGLVIVWDANTGLILTTLHHPFPVWSVAFSPDGLKLASGSADCTIRVWRVDNTREQLKIIKAHRSWVRSVAWSPDGQQLISASSDKTVKFWDSSNGGQIGQPCTGHTKCIYSLAISSGGSFIATASKDKTVRLWSTETHQQIGQALKHTTSALSVAIFPNKELLVSGDRQGKVLLWSIENTLSAVFGLGFSYDSSFMHRCKAKVEQTLHAETLSDAEKIIALNPSSYVGYELMHATLHKARRHGEAIEAFKTMLSKLDNAPNPRVRQLLQNYVSPSEVEDAIRRVIDAQLENAPLRLLGTSTGRLCDRDAQIGGFLESTEYKELFYSSMMHACLRTEPISKAVAKYFSWVMLSHRWERKEPLLHDIQDNVVYDLDPVGTMVKLQTFCKTARDAGHRWAWSDTCCIDQNNNVEVQRSVNSMFIWYRNSALTIIYLSDVPPSSKSGALANSAWNTRGWTVQEFLAPMIVLFYQADWTLYLTDCSPNHKESVNIMQELEHSTGINSHTLVTFHPGMRDAREKLQWASSRVTTLQEDIAYSLFGIFGVHLNVIYGEKKENALGRLLQEIIAQSGDITALDWVGKPSTFNSCLPADIIVYKAPPCPLPSLPEDEMQRSVSRLRNAVAVESALGMYSILDNLSAPRFVNSRLQLPCIVFPVTEVKRRRGQHQVTRFTYHVKADGLEDMLITTGHKLLQFSRARPTQQTFLLVRPWNRYGLGLPDFADDGAVKTRSTPMSLSDQSQSLSGCSEEDAPVDLESDSDSRALRLLVRLGQPFGALLLAQQRGEEYKRIASDNNIIARTNNMADVLEMMNINILEIL